MTQVILVVCMIIAAALAVRYWNSPLPKPDFSLSLPETITSPKPAASEKMIRVVCPDVPMEDPEGNPKWTVAPQPTDRDYPARALRHGILGVVSVMCVSNPDGMVSNCTAAEENPTGYGFGESAIKIVQRGCMNTYSPELPPKVISVKVPFSLD